MFYPKNKILLSKTKHYCLKQKLITQTKTLLSKQKHYCPKQKHESTIYVLPKGQNIYGRQN